MDNAREWTPGRIIRLGFLGFVGLAVVIAAFCSFTTVEYGHVGVKSVFGSIKSEQYEPGFCFKFPWVTVIPVKVQLTPYSHPVNASSKDLQVVTTAVTVTYSINSALAGDLLKQIGDQAKVESAIMLPATEQSVKSVTAKYTAEELVTKRSQVMTDCENALREFVSDTLKEKGVDGALRINTFAITDFKFSKEFNEAIEAKVKTEQEALKALNEKKKKITDAEATAESVKKAAEADAFRVKQAAEAEAYRLTQTAQAQKASIEAEGEALRKYPDVLKLRITTRWNGILPNFLGGNTPIPFLDLNDVKSQPQK